MKKLMVVLAAIALAGASQAAMIDWAIAKNGTKNYAGTASAMTVYLLSASQWSAIQSQVESKGEAALTAGTYLASTTSSTATQVLLEKVAVPGYDPGQNVAFYSVIFDKDSSNKPYYKAATVSQAVYDPSDTDYSTAKTASFTAIKFNQATWTAVAPEPTSGLLMLVGLGALALRRRRA